MSQASAAPSKPAKGERRTQILQALAGMLENPQAEKITTAALAKRLDVSEAALYRHFASKAKMYEGLIEFIEASLLGLMQQIASAEQADWLHIRQMLHVLLAFAQKNPGMTRVLIGDALMNEDERLQQRVTQLIARLEAMMKQHLRQVAMDTGWQPPIEVGAYSALLMSWVVGQWHGYVRSGFKSPMVEAIEPAWQVMGLPASTSA